jgi:hypothetical protein
MSDFVKVVDANGQVHVINTRQIVRVHQKHPPAWDVILTAGDPVTLTTAEAEKLFRHGPAVQHDPAAQHEPVAQHGQNPRELGGKLTDH